MLRRIGAVLIASARAAIAQTAGPATWQNDLLPRIGITTSPPICWNAGWLGLKDTRPLLNGEFEPFDMFQRA